MDPIVLLPGLALAAGIAAPAVRRALVVASGWRTVRHSRAR